MIKQTTNSTPASLLSGAAENTAGFLAITGLRSPVLTSTYSNTPRSVLPSRTNTGSSVRFVEDQDGAISTAGLIAIVMSLLFVSSTIFGVWAFMSRSSYKNESDKKVATAVESTKKEVEAAKDAEFEQTSKQPTKVFSGAQTYGSLTFSYPRTWSAYVESSTSTTPLDATFHPDFVSNSKDIAYALRVEIVESPYDEVVAQLDNSVKKGTVTANAFVPKLVPTSLGLRFSGEIASKKTGVMIVLPLRDNTIKIWTESNEFVADLDTFVLESLSYQP